MKTTAIFLLAFSSLAYQCFSQGVTPHPVPEEFVADRYNIKINGQQVQVFHAGLNVYFAGFDFTGKADVKIMIAGRAYEKEVKAGQTQGFWKDKAMVRPLSRDVNPQTNGAEVSFSLKEAGQYAVERPGISDFKDEVLFLFANRPDNNLPKVNDSGVIHLKPGIHQQHIDLKSNQTLYLEAGAVLFGSINVWDAKNVRILGRGTVVYYGPQSEDHDDGWKHQRNWHPLTTHNVEGLTVSGITFVGRSRTWSVQMHTTFDAVFDNIKILAVNPQNINGDGFDWYGGRRTKIRNSLVRSQDDCFAFFTPDSSQDMWATNKDTDGEVKDILIENCVLWTSLANIYRVGFNGQALKTDNILMQNCDVIHIGDAVVSNGRIYRVLANLDDKQYKSLTRPAFENGQKVLDSINWLMFQKDTSHTAYVRNVTFRNINLYSKRIPFQLTSYSGASSHSYYPGAPIPNQGMITLDNIKVLNDRLGILAWIGTPCNMLTITNTTLKSNGIKFRQVKEYKKHPATHLNLTNCVFTNTGKLTLVINESPGKEIFLKTSGSMQVAKDFSAKVDQGPGKIVVESDLTGLLK